jgi:hypothetical protein
VQATFEGAEYLCRRIGGGDEWLLLPEHPAADTERPREAEQNCSGSRGETSNAAMRLWLCVILVAQAASAQTWELSAVADGYIVPDEGGYVSPIFYADRDWLHLEARYNYEELRTGSLWAGYNFSFGKKVNLQVTPMIGAVFGRINGIAPGVEGSLTYKRLELAIASQYVILPSNPGDSFYLAWPTVTYSMTSWLRAGLVAQRTQTYQTPLEIQRGFLVGVSRKRFEFTTYVFNLGWTRPTWVLEFGSSF